MKRTLFLVIALVVLVACSKDSRVEFPTATPTWIPTATSTPISTNTPTPTDTPEPTNTPAPIATSVPVEPTNTPDPCQNNGVWEAGDELDKNCPIEVISVQYYTDQLPDVEGLWLDSETYQIRFDVQLDASALTGSTMITRTRQDGVF